MAQEQAQTKSEAPSHAHGFSFTMEQQEGYEFRVKFRDKNFLPFALRKASDWGRIRAGRQRLGATIGHAHRVETTVRGVMANSNYLDKGLPDRLGEKVTIVSEPGPGVLRNRPAITAVAAKDAALKPYQTIPVAFVVSSVKGRGKEAAIEIAVRRSLPNR